MSGLAVEIYSEGSTHIRCYEDGRVEGLPEGWRAENHLPQRVKEIVGGVAGGVNVEGLDVVYYDEVQLMDWGESRTRGPWVKLRLVSPGQLEAFRGLDPEDLKRSQHILRCALFRGDIVIPDDEPDPEAEFGELADTLWLSKVLATDPWMAQIGTDEEYTEWCRAQPSCISSHYNEFPSAGLHAGQGRSLPHHLRRASTSGTGIKGKYITIPVTHEEHEILHSDGELAFAMPKHFDGLLQSHRHRWAWQKLKADLGYDSWKQVPPEVLYLWCVDHDLVGMLPPAYRTAALARLATRE